MGWRTLKDGLDRGWRRHTAESFGRAFRAQYRIHLLRTNQLPPIQVLGHFRVSTNLDVASLDPFADEGDLNDVTVEVGTTEYIHIRIQQRNGRKTLTTLQGLPKRESPPVLLCYRSLK